MGIGFKKKQEQLYKDWIKLGELKLNKAAVREYDQYIESIKSMHKQCDEPTNWQDQLKLPPPFNSPSHGPELAEATRELEQFKPTLLERWFTSLEKSRRKQLEDAVWIAKRKEQKAYEEWEKYIALVHKVIEGNADAYQQAIEDINPLEEMQFFGSDFIVNVINKKKIEVQYRIKSENLIPKFVLSLTPKGKLSKKQMLITHYHALVQDYICSSSIRIARDILALLPIDKVIVHSVDNLLNPANGHKEDAIMLSAIFERSTVSSLNFVDADPSDVFQNFRHNMDFQKTTGMKPVARINLVYS